MSFLQALDAVLVERDRQDEKWGEQNHPDGTGSEIQQQFAEFVRERTTRAAKEGKLTWADVLGEEVAEAFAESDEVKLVEELTHTIAVAFAWIEAIERRTSVAYSSGATVLEAIETAAREEFGE